MSQTNLIQRTLFAQDSVKQLRQSDFVDLDSDTKINIKYRDCMLVLFYGDNVESINLATVWSVAARTTVGPIFAAVNLMIEPKIAQAFTSLNMQNGSLHWAALKTIPYILVYQNGWPIAFYNGERSVQSIIDYALTLACKAEYHEPFNLFGGMTITSADNLLIRGDTQYGIPANPARKDSVSYRANENVRGYDPADTPKQAGSAAERSEAVHVLANEQATRVGLPQSVVPVTAAPIPGEEAPTGEAELAPPGEAVAEPTPQALAGGVRVLPPASVEEGVAVPTQLVPPPGSAAE